MVNSKQDVINLFAYQVFNEMNEALYSYENYDEGKLFQTVKKLASLTNELFKDSDVKKLFIELANKSIPNGKNNNQKIETFDMFRNYFSHFPIFEKYEDAYINKELLHWNKSGKGKIEKYFEKYQNTEISFLIIYKMVNGVWTPEQEIKLFIPALPEKEKLYLKNIISLKDVYLTFSIVKYYLKEMGLVINEEVYYSI